MTQTFFAIQLLVQTSPHQIAGMFCEAAKQAGTLFSVLDSLGTIEAGATKFVRLRSDLADPVPALQAMMARGHGVVYRGPEGYELHLGSRVGRVSTSLMVGSPVRNPQSWRGPRVKHWERQFMAGP